jgi:CheY-like chemotaxis protein
MHQSLPNAYEGKVFVIDDDDDLRESLSEALEDEHFLVLPGRNGHEALSRMRGVLPPRVAVVDLAMPDMNGWQLVETMKSDPKLAEIPVIILSGSGNVDVPGAERVFAKPVELDDLLDAVRECCQKDSDEPNTH